MATLTIADLDNGKRDLQTVDEVANSRAATATTRFGQQTTTLYESIRRINATGDEILSNLGFRVPVPYASGLNVSDSRFTVTGPDGKVYAPLSAPFTTGAWDPSQWYVLQNDLNDHKLLVFDTLLAAQAAAAVLPDGQPVSTLDGNGRFTVAGGALAASPEIDFAKNYVAGTLGKIAVNFQIDVTQFPWLAKGDAKYQNPSNGQWYKDPAYSQPATDDFPAIQAAFNWAAGKDGVRVWIPAGFFLLKTGSPQVPSNVQVDGVGREGSLLIQPNYYRYDRPTVPYDRAAVVDWNALWMDITTSNVSIQNIGMLGPFYRQDGDYSAHPVENWPASNGVHHRGNDYEFRKSLPYSTVGGFNIKVTDCYLEGWAEEAIQLDLVEGFEVYRNKIRRVGRGGLRTYGGVNGWSDFNDIEHVYPGDYLNSRVIGGVTIGGNRVYGVEFTRVYQAGCRPSEDIWVSFNRVRDCIQWKCMGTHGGRRIRFLFNDLEDGHHGIGVDKGGFTEAQGISPPSNIEIIGNRIVRIAPPDSNEGDREGGPGQAIFCTAHDQTDTHVGRGLIVHSNYAKGWGCDNLTGGAWLGNWIDVQWGSNTWEKCVGTAVRIRDRVDEIVMAPQIVRDMVPSAAGQLRGIGVESANVRGMLQGGTFSNSNATALTAFYLANPGTDMGVTIQPGSRLIGNTILCNLPNNEQGGGAFTVPKAVGNVTVTGGTATLRVGRGVAAVAYEAVGTYLITLKESASNMNNLAVFPACIGTNRKAYWQPVSPNSFRIYTESADAVVKADNSFVFSVNLF